MWTIDKDDFPRGLCALFVALITLLMPIREDWLANRHSSILNTWNNLVLMELLKCYSRLWFSILDRSPYPFHGHFVSSPRWRSGSRALIMMLKRPLHSPRNVIERGDIKNRACQIRLQPFVPKKNSPSKLFIRHLVNKSSLFCPLRLPGRRPYKWLIKTLPCICWVVMMQRRFLWGRWTGKNTQLSVRGAVGVTGRGSSFVSGVVWIWNTSVIELQCLYRFYFL